MRVWEDLSEKEQKRASRIRQSLYLQLIAEGTISFEEGSDLQDKIDGIMEEVEKSQVLCSIGERLLDEEEIKQEIKRMAEGDLEEAYYPDVGDIVIDLSLGGIIKKKKIEEQGFKFVE